jgi:D-glycero-D-manno-heptose 1,7-bisphosphate phosphatase
MSGRKAIFLDRDGTIIEDRHYPRDPAEVTLTPGALEGLRAMSEKGYLLFIVSNQSGVGRGIISDVQFRAVHERVCELLKAGGVDIASFGYCFHTPEDNCRCRKPAVGLIPKEHAGVRIDWTGSLVVGDKPSDLMLAEKLGAKGVLVATGYGEKTLAEWSPDLPPPEFHPNLKSFADTLCSSEST